MKIREFAQIVSEIRTLSAEIYVATKPSNGLVKGNSHRICQLAKELMGILPEGDIETWVDNDPCCEEGECE